MATPEKNALTGGRVIACLTTIPSRIAHVLPVIANLVEEQTRRPDAVHLFVPPVAKRSGLPYEIPSKLEAYAHAHPDVFRITRVDRDYGPATKLIPALGLYNEPADRIVTVDDDILLGKHVIEDLVEASDVLRRRGEATACVAKMGITHDGKFVHSEFVDAGANVPVAVVGGYRGVLYPRCALDSTLLQDLEAVEARVDPFLSDDHLFSWNLLRRGVRCVVASTRHPAAPVERARESDERWRACLAFRSLDLPEALNDAGGARTPCAESAAHLARLYDERGWPRTHVDL
jgi:hypothetical protein